jgi:multidrug efflux pump subunit AcrA (membrane-fusion protein)
VPQQITTTAVLAPRKKNCYYAPLDATVTTVHFTGRENEPVRKGEVLLQLESVTLNQSLSRLKAEQQANLVRKEHLEFAQAEANARAERPSERRVIGTELDQVEGKIDANSREQKFIDAEIAKLKIVALEDGELTSWDVSNRLLGRPVSRGELLLATCDPSTDWELQVSIPEHRVGLVSDRLVRSKGRTVPLRFSLTSHPNVLMHGALTWMADQAARNATGATVVLSRAAVLDELPLKKEGAIAHVTLDCGRVPAIWLVVRDAYWACMSRLKMMW